MGCRLFSSGTQVCIWGTFLSNVAIVVTCSFRPSSTVNVKRNDWSSRLIDYKKSLPNWIEIARERNLKLIILENTDSLEILQTIIDKYGKDANVSTLQVAPDTDSPMYGISSGEFKMLQHLIRLNVIDTTEFIWKCGGRNTVLNARRVLHYNGADIVCERFFKGGHTINPRFFGMKTKLWKQFLNNKPKFGSTEDSQSQTFSSMEHYLTSFVLEAEMRGAKQLSFSQVPIHLGYSGSTGKEIYTRSSRSITRVANLLRPFAIKLLRGVAP